MSAPSVADLKAHMPGLEGDSEHDTALSNALAAAIATVEREAGLYVERVERTIYRSTRGAGGASSIDFAQPVEISLVEVADGDLLVSGYTALDAASWELRGNRLVRLAGAIWGGSRWPAGRDSVRITLTAGYDEDNPMPDDLRQAILDYAAVVFRGRRAVTTIDEAGQPQEVSPRLPSTFWATIRGHRIVPGF